MRTTSEIQAWREQNPWESLDLREANLRGANLRGANLRGADLRGADLYGANLYGADLRWADLCEANLRGANLRGANLCEVNLYGANGVYLLNTVDPRGYVPIVQVKDGTTHIISGCRDFSYDEALDHWGDSYGGERNIGDRYLAGLTLLDSDDFRKWLEDERAKNKA